MPYTMPPPPPPPDDSPNRQRVRAVAIAGMVLLVVVVSIVWYAVGQRRPSDAAPMVEQQRALDPDARAPADTRVRVIVLNGTEIRGLARRATNLVRDLGYDVVEYGNASAPRDSTAILVHTGHADWARRLARGVGSAIIDEQPDSSRYVDLTLVIGRDWNPPTQPFRP